MEQLTEDDIKFFLSLDPDEEAVRKAIEQINSQIQGAKVEKVKFEVEGSVRQREAAEKTQEKGTLGRFMEGFRNRGEVASARPGTEAVAAKDKLAGTLKGGGTAAAAGSVVMGILQAVSKAATAGLKAFNAGLSITAGMLRDVQGPLGGVGAGLNLVSEGMELLSEGVKKIPGVGQLLGPVLDQLAKMPKILGEILATGLNMASKANPGLLKQLSIALEDAQATIGQAFLPAIEEMIPVIREIGTIIAQALPSNEEMRAMFRGLFESIKELMREVAPLIGPLLQGLVSVVKFIVNGVTALVSALKFMYEAVRVIVKGLTLGFVDLGKLQNESDPKKRGAISAARTPSIGSIEEFQRSLQLRTAHGPRGMGPESVPNNVGKMAGSVENIEKWFQRMDPEKFKEIVRAGNDRGGDTRRIVNAAELGLRGG